MKSIRKIFCTLLALVLCFSFAASCTKKPEGGNTVEATNIDFVKDSKTDYKIVVPDKAGDNISLAARELQTFILQASGASVEIVKDSAVSYSEGAKFLSVGNTSILPAANLDLSVNKLNTDGFYLKTVGSTVFMVGATDDGSLYAAYEFLERTFNFRFYAADETVYDEMKSVKLSKFDITDVPDFAHRNSYWKSYKDNPNIRGRFRSLNNDQWGLFAHSYFLLLPTEQYLLQHPDWYYPQGSSSPKQLCLNAAGLKDELVKNLKKYILQKNNSRYFMVGQEDTNSACTCEKCTASNKLYGGISGTTMVFINQVARDIKAWQKTNEWLASDNPNREIWIGTFAYQKTRPAPVIFNEKDGSYTPANPAVVAEDNVLVQYAPLEACYAHSFDAPCNRAQKTAMDGWHAVTSNFAIWSYSTNFTNYFMHFNNFGSIQDDYRIFKNMGARVIMDQGTGETTASPFHDLRAYLHAKLMWNVESDVNALIDDFLHGFYKQAYKPMRDYFDLMRLHYATLDAKSRQDTGTPFNTYVYNIYDNNNEDLRYWSKSFLDQAMNKLNEAFSLVASVQDEPMREKLRLRVLAETLSIRYLYIQFYIGDFMPAEQKQMIDSFADDCTAVGFVCWKENTPVQEKLAAWRQQIAS